MVTQIRVAILDNHQSIIDGYIYRLAEDPAIRVVASATYGDELESMLASHPVDVLLLGLSVPNSAENHTPFPVFFIIPRILKDYRHLKILAISLLDRPALIEALVDVGISGYIYKNDQASIQRLASVVGSIAHGGMFFSRNALQQFRGKPAGIKLTRDQVEALSLCAARPEEDALSLSRMLGIAESTLRNRLSEAYKFLGVKNRSMAVLKAQQMGILPVLAEEHIPGKE